MVHPTEALLRQSGLWMDEQGIWRSGQVEPARVSYPADGSETCFAVEDESFWFQHRNNCILSLVERFRPSGTILDVGGGNGDVSRHLATAGYNMVLLEPQPVGVFHAHVHRSLPWVICADLQHAHLPPGSFGAIGLFDVLEHIPDDLAFLGQVADLLEPNGLLYLTVPAFPWLWSASDHRAGHFRRYGKHTLEGVLRERFDALYLTALFRPLLLPMFLLRVLPFRMGLARERQVLSDNVEHGTGNGKTVNVIKRFLRREEKYIQTGRFLRTGTTWLCAARKRERE